MALLSFMTVAERRAMDTGAEAMDTALQAADTSARVMDTGAVIDILALIKRVVKNKTDR